MTLRSSAESSFGPRNTSGVKRSCSGLLDSVAERKRLIYVVDDEQMIGQTLSLILEMSGYETMVFFTAESALRAIEDRAPDLVISDVVLNGAMDGIEFAERLSRTHRSVEVLLMSGLGTFSDAYEAASSRGFRPAIQVKPVPPKLMLEAIEARLSGESLRDGEIGQHRPFRAPVLPS